MEINSILPGITSKNFKFSIDQGGGGDGAALCRNNFASDLRSQSCIHFKKIKTKCITSQLQYQHAYSFKDIKATRLKRLIRSHFHLQLLPSSKHIRESITLKMYHYVFAQILQSKQNQHISYTLSVCSDITNPAKSAYFKCMIRVALGTILATAPEKSKLLNL